MKQRSFSRSQRTTILVAILCVVITIVVMQLWLLTATMDAFLRRDESVLIPAAIASFACLALNIGLLVHHRKVDD